MSQSLKSRITKDAANLRPSLEIAAQGCRETTTFLSLQPSTIALRISPLDLPAFVLIVSLVKRLKVPLGSRIAPSALTLALRAMLRNISPIEVVRTGLANALASTLPSFSTCLQVKPVTSKTAPCWNGLCPIEIVKLLLAASIFLSSALTNPVSII